MSNLMENNVTFSIFLLKKKVKFNNTTYLFQNSFIKKLLQFFITVVDTELFKTVVFKVFWKIEVKLLW